MLHKGWQVASHLLCTSVLTFFLWAPHTLFADSTTLERIAAAEHEVSYVGVRLKTFSSSRGTRTFEELIIHKSPDASYRKELAVVGERQSFRGSNNRGEHRRDSRRRGRDEDRRDSRGRERDRNTWRQVRRLFSEKEIKLIAQNYELEKSKSSEKIANHETDVLTITPRFDGRPTKRIFFARRNGVILRVEDLDAEGILREMFVYIRISFDPETVERKWKAFQKEIKPQPRHSHSISLVEGKKVLRTKPIQPEYLPPGFQLQDIRSIKDKENTIHLIYTDGLLGFSIFETTNKPSRRSDRQNRGSDVIELNGTPVRKHQRGPTHAFDWSSTEIHFFLFGTMPATEMQKVVASIIHKAKQK